MIVTRLHVVLGLALCAAVAGCSSSSSSPSASLPSNVAANAIVDDVVDKTIGAHHHVTCLDMVVASVDGRTRRVEFDMTHWGVIDEAEAIVEPVLQIFEDMFDEQRAVDGPRHPGQHRAITTVGGTQQREHVGRRNDRIQVGEF